MDQLRERPLDFQGGLGFSVWPEYFFLSLSGQIFFFNLSWARIFFFQAILGQNICFYAIQGVIQIWKQHFSWAANRLQNYYIEVVCCVCVCVCPTTMTLSGITLPIPNTLQYNFIWGFFPDVSCYWNLTRWAL